VAGDSLREIIETARQAMPDVPADVWDRFEAAVRLEHGATRIYIAAHTKRRLLREIAAPAAEEDAAALALRLGVSVRRVQQLRQLCK
jgi:hypothetical protein